MVNDKYRSVKKTSSGLYKEKGSKFIALAIPVTTEEEVGEKLEEVKKEYHDARHHCYAYRIGYPEEKYRINDNGEPSGTAGRPIYGQILSKELHNILIVVIRYFGGTKLGVSGLINAYKTAAKDAINNAGIIENTLKDSFDLHFDYPRMNDVMRIIKEHSLEQIDHDFGITCRIRFLVRKNSSEAVIKKFLKINGVIIEQANICK